jgi:hypothetical protein
MTPHILISAIAVAAAALALAFAVLAFPGVEGAPPAGGPTPGTAEVVGAESLLRPLRPELALGDHQSPFTFARQGQERGVRIPLPPPPPVQESTLPILPLAPER